MIKQISSQANPSEINGIATRTIQSVKNSGTKDFVVSSTIGIIELDNNNLTGAINRKTSNDATQVVQLLERNRDKGLKSLFKSVDGACYRLDEKVETAAKLLKEVINRHGSTMYNYPQDQQTSAMASLFLEFESPVLVSALNLTGAAIMVTETKDANQKYLDELGKKVNDEAKKDEIQLVGDTTKKVKVNLDKLMNYLDAYLAVSDDAILKTLNTELSGIFDQANSTIKARNTRKKNSKEGDPIPLEDPII